MGCQISWRYVEGYRGLYEISEFGDIRRCTTRTNTTAGRILKPTVVRGYPKIVLYKDGQRKMFFVHTLVCTAFKGPRPSTKHQVNHKDMVKTNNAVNNLEWVTCKENVRHAMQQGVSYSHPVPYERRSRGSRHPHAKLSEVSVAMIKSLIANNFTASDVADEFGVDNTTISRIKLNTSWQHVK